MQLHFLKNLERLFIPFLTLLQIEEPLINVLHDQLFELVRTIMMRFLKKSVVGEKTGTSLLSVDVDNTYNRLNMTEKWILFTKLEVAEIRTTEKGHNGHAQFLSYCHKVSSHHTPCQ